MKNQFPVGTLVRTTVSGYPPRGIIVAWDYEGEDALVAMDSTGNSSDGIGAFWDVKLYTVAAQDMEAIEMSQAPPVSLAIRDAVYAVVGTYNKGAGVISWQGNANDAYRASAWYNQRGGDTTVHYAPGGNLDPFSDYS